MKSAPAATRTRIASPVVLVTGATDGIGKQTALDLLRRGSHVLVHGRTAAKAAAVADELAALVPDARHRVEPFGADLSSLAEVRALASQVIARHEFLDVLINNAGVFMNERVVTVDGFEASFAINHLAPFVLTALLLPALRESEQGRVVTVSSIAHNRGRLDWDDLDAKVRFEGYAAYANSKLANVLFAYELAKRLVGTRVTSNALHPGVITTKLLWNGFGSRGDSLERGAATSVKLALDASLAGVTGKYFDNEREARSSAASHDPAAMTRLWEISAARTGASG